MTHTRCRRSRQLSHKVARRIVCSSTRIYTIKLKQRYVRLFVEVICMNYECQLFNIYCVVTKYDVYLSSNTCWHIYMYKCIYLYLTNSYLTSITELTGHNQVMSYGSGCGRSVDKTVWNIYHMIFTILLFARLHV